MLSLSLVLPLNRSPSHSFFLALPRSLSHSFCLTLVFSVSLNSFSLTMFRCLSHPDRFVVSDSHSHTLTHTPSHSLTRRSVSPSFSFSVYLTRSPPLSSLPPLLSLSPSLSLSLVMNLSHRHSLSLIHRSLSALTVSHSREQRQHPVTSRWLAHGNSTHDSYESTPPRYKIRIKRYMHRTTCAALSLPGRTVGQPLGSSLRPFATFSKRENGLTTSENER